MKYDIKFINSNNALQSCSNIRIKSTGDAYQISTEGIYKFESIFLGYKF